MKKKGFTLVELLVVIAIIALLMAMLMPALAKVKKQANAVACLSNLGQWRAIFSMYTNDYDGNFFQGWTSGTGVGYNEGKGIWMNALRPYYGDPKLRLCPMATKMYYTGENINSDPTTKTGAMHPYAAYGIINRNDAIAINGDYTSYAINWWVNNAPMGNLLYSYFWKTCNVGGADKIPVLMDGMFWLARGKDYDAPPTYDGEFEWALPGNGIKRVCTNRHDNGFINGMFMDWSVRKIGLKELWTLKWNRHFDTANCWTKAGGVTPGDWTPWMKDFPEY